MTDPEPIQPDPPARRGPGRPPGSKNRPKAPGEDSPAKKRISRALAKKHELATKEVELDPADVAACVGKTPKQVKDYLVRRDIDNGAVIAAWDRRYQLIRAGDKLAQGEFFEHVFGKTPSKTENETVHKFEMSPEDVILLTALTAKLGGVAPEIEIVADSVVPSLPAGDGRAQG
jgi:hypothetical protein